MISIQNKEKCCGCSACVQRCPKQCISLYEDEEGFLYPRVDKMVCIDCGLCEKVCPILNQSEGHEPIAVYAAKNPNEEIRMQSSSGGIFTMLAERIIFEGGVVFGACWDKDWNVVHDYAESKEDIAKFRGSKYVQSNIGETFKQTETFLKEGRKVLFSGTPCQIAGLKRFLRKDYENLTTVDIICHGVPSPGVFRTYLSEKINEITKVQSFKRPCFPLLIKEENMVDNSWNIKSISFRDKQNGWKKFGFTLVISKMLPQRDNENIIRSYQPLNKNLFLLGFLHNLYLRPSCYTCPAKHLKSGSDITLGDWWGINTLIPQIDDDRGVSAITINTNQGKLVLHNINAKLFQLPYKDLIKNNSAIVKSVATPTNRSTFFIKDKKTFMEKIKHLTKCQFHTFIFAKRITRIIYPNKLVNCIKRFCI